MRSYRVTCGSSIFTSRFLLVFRSQLEFVLWWCDLRLRVCFNNLIMGVFPFDCHHIFKMSHFVLELHGVNPFIFDCPPNFPLTVYIYGVVSSSKVVVTNLRVQSLKSVAQLLWVYPLIVSKM